MNAGREVGGALKKDLYAEGGAIVIGEGVELSDPFWYFKWVRGKTIETHQIQGKFPTSQENLHGRKSRKQLRNGWMSNRVEKRLKKGTTFQSVSMRKKEGPKIEGE